MFKIEKAIPIPEKRFRRKKRGKYPFGEMRCKDSFLVTGARKKQERAVSAASAYGRTHKMKFCSRTVINGTRIWRVA